MSIWEKHERIFFSGCFECIWVNVKFSTMFAITTSLNQRCGALANNQSFAWKESFSILMEAFLLLFFQQLSFSDLDLWNSLKVLESLTMDEKGANWGSWTNDEIKKAELKLVGE